MTDGTAFTVIELRFDMRAGYLYVTSDDVPGLHLCGSDHQAVCDDVIPAVKGLLKLNRGWDVEIVPETEADVFPQPQPNIELPIGKTVERLIAFASDLIGHDQRSTAPA